jgi:hypothetical protein
LKIKAQFFWAFIFSALPDQFYKMNFDRLKKYLETATDQGRTAEK